LRGVGYRELARNNCHLQFVACAMNMKRALVLSRAAQAARMGASRLNSQKWGEEAEMSG
jgi:hypothetical protein